MKLLLGSVFLLASVALSNAAFGQQLGYDLNNWKISSIDVKKDSVEVTFDETNDSNLKGLGSIKAQLSNKEAQGPALQAIMAAYSSQTFVDVTTECRGEGLIPHKNKITEFRAKVAAGPDGK